MKTPSYRPPPHQAKDFIIFFYYYFSTDQNSIKNGLYSLKLQHPQLKKMNNNSQAQLYILKLTKRQCTHTETNV